jgi:hypothetical protein
LFSALRARIGVNLSEGDDLFGGVHDAGPGKSDAREVGVNALRLAFRSFARDTFVVYVLSLGMVEFEVTLGAVNFAVGDPAVGTGARGIVVDDVTTGVALPWAVCDAADCASGRVS